MRNTWHRHDIRLCPHTTQSINHQQWEPPNSKRSELKSFDNTECSLEDTLLWTDTLKANRHSDGTSIPFPTGVPANKIWTGFGTSYATTYLHKLQDKRRNRPISKCGEDDGTLRPCGTPFNIDQTVGKRQKICACRRAYYCSRDNGVKRDHHFVSDEHD